MEETEQSPGSEVDFMSMLSHQLSTPLAAIRWYAELLRMGKMATPLDPGQTEMVNEILTGAVRMGELITDIHNCSWLERDKFTDQQTSVSLVDLVSTVKDQSKADITAKNLTCTVETGQPVPNITASPGILTIIIQNLLSNSVKYTSAGGVITVVLRPASNEEVARSAAREQDSVFLSVTDNGCGIPKAQHAQVFSKFFRADNVSGLNGTGLGVYLVATAVAKLGGGVWFESEEGKGTTFFVVLPTKVTKLN